MAGAPVAGAAAAAAAVGGFAADVVLAGATDTMLDEVIVRQRVDCCKVCAELHCQHYRRGMVCNEVS